MALAGCSDPMDDLTAYVAAVKHRDPGAIEPLPRIKIVEPFVFKPQALRNPFEPDERLREPRSERVETGLRPDTARRKEELESFELDTLRMVGTVSQEGVIWGLLKAQDGAIYRVKVGHYLGKNYGRIVEIKDHRLELVEIVADSTGAWQERKATLKLADTDEK